MITALLNLAEELGSRHDLHVFTADGPSGPGRYRRAGANVYQLGGTADLAERSGRARRLSRLGRFLMSLVGEIRRIHAEGPFDLLHAFWALDTAFAATIVGRHLRVPVVVSVGGGEAVWIPAIAYGGAGSFAGRVRLNTSLRLAQAITAGSAFAIQNLPAFARRRARVIPLGVRCQTFDATPERPPGPPWRLLQIADLNLVKDQETLLRAFQCVVERLSDVSLDCIGEDTLNGELRSRANELGIGSYVRFHGFLPQRVLPDFYRRAHLHLVSSRYESQGVAILEAAAAGVPTVGTAVGLVPTLHPLAARCVPPGDAVALAEAISALLLDEAARRAMGAAARRWAHDHDARWTALEFERVYVSLLHGRPNARPEPHKLSVLGSRSRIKR
ncbi:MAG: glycosyltransferase family 4 protein [Polyangiaceae bacterium]